MLGGISVAWNHITAYKLLMLDKNTWNSIIVYKQMTILI